MSSAFYGPLQQMQHSATVRYTVLFTLLLAVMYVITLASGGYAKSSSDPENNGMVITEETIIQAPNEALLNTQEEISTDAEISASTNVQSEQTTTSSTEANSPTVEASVNVNGEQINLDDNSRVRREIRSDNQKTTVDISTSSNSISNNNSSLNISVKSTSKVDDDN